MSRKNYKLSELERKRRRFSETFKVQKVRELESGQVRICEIKKEYDVSCTAIYKWINKYSMSKKKKPERLIIESESDVVKLQQLRKKIAELERTIGQKQVELDFKDKMIDLAEDHYDIDIKKKFEDSPSISSGKTEKKSQ